VGVSDRIYASPILGEKIGHLYDQVIEDMEPG